MDQRQDAMLAAARFTVAVNDAIRARAGPAGRDRRAPGRVAQHAQRHSGTRRAHRRSARSRCRPRSTASRPACASSRPRSARATGTTFTRQAGRWTAQPAMSDSRMMDWIDQTRGVARALQPAHAERGGPRRAGGRPHRADGDDLRAERRRDQPFAAGVHQAPTTSPTASTSCSMPSCGRTASESLDGSRTSAVFTVAVSIAVWSGLAFVRAPTAAAQADRARLQLTPIPGAVRRNVVFVLVDDLRFDAMGVAGHPWLETPNIDALARRGVHLPNAFVTTALCSPSRASILTGQYAHRHRVVDNNSPIPAGHDVLPAVPAGGRLRDGVHRQVAHGRRKRRAAARLRSLGELPGPGHVPADRAMGSTSTARPCRSAATSPTSSPTTPSTG